MFTKKISIFLLSFFFSYVSIHAGDRLVHTIDNLHENQKPKLSKIEYVHQRQNQRRKVAHVRQMTGKEKAMQRNIERKNKSKGKHFTLQL